MQCSKTGESSAQDREKDEQKQLDERLGRIRRKIVVLSGKGGVGKSTVAVNLALALSLSGERVGLLDVDIHGPSIPTMLGLERDTIQSGGDGLIPIDLGGLKVMSIGFMLKNQDDAVIWRGPMKMGVIKQFLKDVDWGELDYLIIDSPPGTGDEPLSVCQLIDGLEGAIIVTTPQKVAAVDVRKSVSFCRQLNVPVIGVVENMSGFACPKCGEITHIFSSGAGKSISDDMGVPFLGSIPLDPKLVEASDGGRAFIHHYAETPTASIMMSVIELVKAFGDEKSGDGSEAQKPQKGTEHMKIAIPVAGGRLAMHFGHCEQFALVDVDEKAKTIKTKEMLDAPEHEPGLLPRWLAEKGANVIIAGGMGSRAQGLFAENKIKVIVGAPAETPEKVVEAYLAGSLKTGDNVCDH